MPKTPFTYCLKFILSMGFVPISAAENEALTFTHKMAPGVVFDFSACEDDMDEIMASVFAAIKNDCKNNIQS